MRWVMHGIISISENRTKYTKQLRIEHKSNIMPAEGIVGPAMTSLKEEGSGDEKVEAQDFTVVDYKDSGNGNEGSINGVDHSQFEEDGDEIEEFPDGGLRAWLAVLGVFVGLVPVFGMLNAMGAIQSYISKNQLKDESSLTVSWIFCLYIAFSFLSCVFSGGYFDRNGGQMPMVVGTILFVGGLFALANCQRTFQFILAFSLCSGIGTGILITPLVSVVATWFNRKRGIATSVATMGGSIGGVIFPIMLRRLYDEVGYHWAIRVLAFVFLACLLFALKFAREREKPLAEEFGSRREMIRWYASSSLNWKYFLDTRFLFTALAVSFSECSLVTAATYLASYSLARGNSQAMSYDLITVTNAAGMLGRFVPAYIADKWLGRFNVSIITVGLAAFFDFVIWLPFGGNAGALWAYACLYGFSTGSILTLSPVCIGQISSIQDFGKRYSTVYFLQAILTIPILPIGGIIVDDGSIANYNKFIIYVSVLMAAGSVCYLISKNLCVGCRLARF